MNKDSQIIRHLVKIPGQRLDKYLAEAKIATSRSEAAKWIKEGFVLVNGQVEKSSYVVKDSDKLVVTKPSLKTRDLFPKKIDFEIVYEDDDLLVINKPAGLVVHPGAGNYDDSLVHGLLYHLQVGAHCHVPLSRLGGEDRPGIVHRLDKGTSGLIVVAKTDETHQNLSEQFQKHLVEKEYCALVLGRLERDEQTLVTLIKRSEMNRKKFVVNQKKGKEAITHIKVLQKNEKASFVAVRIETGRTHQIRVHLNFLKHPIMGDETYGGTKKLKIFSEDEKRFIQNLGRPLLHSRFLSFFHPKTKKRVSFVAEIGEDFEKALKIFFG